MARYLWHYLRRVLALQAVDRADLLAAYAHLGLTEVALRRVGFRALVERTPVVGWSPERVLTPADWQRARRAAYWVDLAARHHVVGARCLHRSLVLHRWLRRQGLPSTLRIGVRKDEGALRAHAWVELDGQAVNDHPDALSSFVPLSGPLGQRLFHW